VAASAIATPLPSDSPNATMRSAGACVSAKRYAASASAISPASDGLPVEPP
jgi:hypothetical protein